MGGNMRDIFGYKRVMDKLRTTMQTLTGIAKIRKQRQQL